MKHSLNNSSNTPTSLASSSNQAPPGITSFTQVSYSIIASVAFCGNLLVILIFVQDRKLLKKSYNMLILSLAISDVITALSLVTNPAFVLGDLIPDPTNHTLGQMFCSLIWSRVFLFQLVVFSAYICLALTTERWCAVIKPLRYNEAFSTKKTLIYIFFAWLWSLILCGTSIFEVDYVPSNPPNRRCQWKIIWGGNTARAVVGIVQVLLKMAFPSLAMLLLFIHMVYKTSRSAVASEESKAKMRGKMTRMVGAACITLIVCFAPSQTNYALAMAGKLKLDTSLHHTLSLLVFVSSCLNPFIYGLSNKNYRRGFRNILFTICPKVLSKNKVTGTFTSSTTKKQEENNLSYSGPLNRDKCGYTQSNC